MQSAPRKILRPHPLPATCIHVYILILILHGKMLIRKFFHPILLLMLVILIIKPHSEQEREPPVSTLFKLKSQSYDMIIRKVLCSMIKQVLHLLYQEAICITDFVLTCDKSFANGKYSKHFTGYYFPSRKVLAVQRAVTIPQF